MNSHFSPQIPNEIKKATLSFKIYSLGIDVKHRVFETLGISRRDRNPILQNENLYICLSETGGVFVFPKEKLNGSHSNLPVFTHNASGQMRNFYQANNLVEKYCQWVHFPEEDLVRFLLPRG